MAPITTHPYLSEAQQQELHEIATSLSRPGGGILAADETPKAMQARFQSLNIENTPEVRRQYRELLFTSPKEKLTPLSGVILQNETLFQKTDDGQDFISLVKSLDIIPGITVDKGWIELAGSPKEVFTQGLDDLDTRCKEYKALGCQFTKWRMVVTIGQDLPSVRAVEEGARELALYANICQRNGLVPIIEPDISRDGDHDLTRSLEVSEQVLAAVYKALADYHVYLEGTVLKPSMVTSGTKCQSQASPDQVAHLTLLALSRHVPAAVPGIFFLSGGQTEQMATDNLMAINTYSGKVARPWHISFCYGRALQDSCRAAWLGNNENKAKAQEAFIARVQANGAAVSAKPL